MTKIEEELNKFRKQKAKESSTAVPSWLVNWIKLRKPFKMELPVFETSLSGESDLIELNASNETFDSSQSTNWTRIDFVILFLKIILYCILQTIAVIIEFGAVFFAIALLYFICSNLREKKKKYEPSAYSVFNPNCEPIQGTLDAKTLERGMALRPLSL